MRWYPVKCEEDSCNHVPKAAGTVSVEDAYCVNTGSRHHFFLYRCSLYVALYIASLFGSKLFLEHPAPSSVLASEQQFSNKETKSNKKQTKATSNTQKGK